MYAKCTCCKKDWNISIKTDLNKPYVCPKCAEEQRQKSLKRRGTVSKVLLKNKRRK